MVVWLNVQKKYIAISTNVFELSFNVQWNATNMNLIISTHHKQTNEPKQFLLQCSSSIWAIEYGMWHGNGEKWCTNENYRIFLVNINLYKFKLLLYVWPVHYRHVSWIMEMRLLNSSTMNYCLTSISLHSVFFLSSSLLFIFTFSIFICQFKEDLCTVHNAHNLLARLTLNHFWIAVIAAMIFFSTPFPLIFSMN